MMATLAEKATPFASLAECEATIAVPGNPQAHGSQFNRRYGYVTRCELIDGVPGIVVYPRDYVASSRD